MNQGKTLRRHKAEYFNNFGLVCLLFAATMLVMAGQLFAVDIYPGTNIQSVVNANPAGTVYTLKSGVHRLQTILPKSGDVYQGEQGTIMSGATLLTSFSQQGSWWVATGQLQQGVVNTSVACQPGWDGCQYPEQLFFDDVPLQHVSSLSAIGPGKWYFDYSGRAIYLADNPAGHKVETSITPHAFTPGLTNVTIQNLTIEKYASPAQDAAVSTANSWTIQNCEIRLNHGMAVRLQSGLRVLSSYVHHNGQGGISGDGDNALVDGNEIAYNNTAHFDYGGTNSEAGGTKFSGTNYLVVTNNYVHDNIGPALWLDSNNYSWTIQSNRTANNLEAGVLDEISYDGVIRYNIFENEGNTPNSSQSSFWYRSAILVGSSPNAEIYGNTLINSANGIGAVANNRGSGNRGPYLLQNLYVHDNTIVQSTGYAAGIVADSAYLSAYTSSNNRFVNNTYKLPASGVLYSWYTGGSGYVDLTSSQWIAAGEDTSGTWLPSSSPVPSTQYATGARVTLAIAGAVRSLPTYTGSVVANLAVGAGGAVTAVRGPVYADGDTWWQVRWDSGARGWIPASILGGLPADTTPPTLGISYPYNNSTVSGSVGVSVIASDNVGVTRVQYYVDGALIATSNAAPWGITWNTAQFSPGSHGLLAIAYDAAGNSGGGAITVTVLSGSTDTVPPTIGISSPRNGATVSGVVTVTTVASDNVGVVKVELYVDNALVATTTSAPWSLTWNTAGYSTGTHQLLTKAYDAAGNTGGGVIYVTK